MSPNAALAIAALLATSACGGSSTNDLTTPTVPAPAPLPFLFRMRLDYETLERSLWTFRSDDHTGKLIPTSETPLGRDAGGWTVHPNQPYVYVGLGGARGPSPASLRTYHVRPDGQLSVAGELPLPDTFGTGALVLDRSGPRLYFGISQGRIAAAAIDAGPARLITDDVFPGFYVGGMTFSSRFAYVNMTRTSEWAINVLPIGATGLPGPAPLQQVDDGSLGLLAASPPSAPFKMIVSKVEPDRNSPQSALQPYTIDPSGLLRRAPGGAAFSRIDLGDYPGALAAVAQPRTVAFHPNGRFLYVGESIEVMQRFVPSHINQYTAGSFIAAYRLNPSAGTLTPVPGSPIRTGFPTQYFHAGTLDFSPSGAFLYAGAGGGAPFQDVLGYRIDAETGALTPLAEAAFTFPRQGYY